MAEFVIKREVEELLELMLQFKSVVKLEQLQEELKQLEKELCSLTLLQYLPKVKQQRQHPHHLHLELMRLFE